MKEDKLDKLCDIIAFLSNIDNYIKNSYEDKK